MAPSVTVFPRHWKLPSSSIIIWICYFLLVSKHWSNLSPTEIIPLPPCPANVSVSLDNHQPRQWGSRRIWGLHTSESTQTTSGIAVNSGNGGPVSLQSTDFLLRAKKEEAVKILVISGLHVPVFGKKKGMENVMGQVLCHTCRHHAQYIHEGYSS